MNFEKFANVELIGFTGHRNKITDVDYLVALNNLYPKARWVTGGAVGFDQFVENFYKNVRGIDTIKIVPDYQSYAGKVAPIIRNGLIVKVSDLLVAGWDNRTTGGTYRTILSARKKNIPVLYAPVVTP